MRGPVFRRAAASTPARPQRLDQNQEGVAGGSFSIFFLDDGTSFDFGPPAGSVLTLD